MGILARNRIDAITRHRLNTERASSRLRAFGACQETTNGSQQPLAGFHCMAFACIGVAHFNAVGHMHAKVCRPGSGKKRRYVFHPEFVFHSLRHTCLTRLGKAGADAFTMMNLAVHSSVTVSQRYVHPTGEPVQLAFDRLEALNRRVLKGTKGKKPPQIHPPTVLHVT